MGSFGVDVRRDNASQYSAVLAGHVVGQVRLSAGSGIWEIYRTAVEPAYEGHGIGSRMMRRVLADAEAEGVRVVPSCWFVSGWMQRHPEYEHLRTNHADVPDDPACRIGPAVVPHAEPTPHL